MTREELIAALERAQGPSRELDAAIAAYVGEAVMPFQPDEHAWMCKDGLGGWMPITRPGSRPHTTNDRYVPRYTASIDAALTLLPEGARISQMGEWDHPILRSNGPWYCIITRQDAERLEDTFLTRCQNGPTPAIALCIAALKARA